MDDGVLSFNNVRPNDDLINEIWAFDVKNLHALADPVLSQYVIALSQWLVYYRAQVNEAKAQINQLKSDLDVIVATCMSEKILKEYRTQTAARAYIIRSDASSSMMDDQLRALQADLVKVEGIDKAITELIAAFKREMTRRDNELYTIRKERYS